MTSSNLLIPICHINLKESDNQAGIGGLYYVYFHNQSFFHISETRIHCTLYHGNGQFIFGTFLALGLGQPKLYMSH
jgi:hypothetical protein